MIKSLGNGKAAGHDEIPNEALKNAPAIMVSEITNLFNRVFDKGVVPESWKKGRLVLIHKKGSKVDPTNYRPLTVLQAVSGLYTKILNNRLTTVVEEHHLLGEIQNGFRKSRSGGDSAFILNSVLWKSAAQKKDIHLAFLDLLKAYDSVDRPTLWRKLKEMGFKGKFLQALQKLYKGDHVTCEVNGVTTRPVYLGRGLRQGCSLSPMLFALYMAGMGQDLSLSTEGVKMYKIVVSGLFFADDVVLVARSAQGLRNLLELVQFHCKDLRMQLSPKKCKIMSKSGEDFTIELEDESEFCLEKVLRFRYLGLECELSPARTAKAMKDRAISVARKYKGACLRIAKDGPDVVEIAVALWENIAKPSLKFGCEAVPFTKTAIDEVMRQQVGIGKSALGLPQTAPNISVEVLLGLKPFKEELYRMQLKFYYKLCTQDEKRWSKDALLDHLLGGWRSPYLIYISEVKKEVGMFRGPVSNRHVDIVLDYYGLKLLNNRIDELNLPAMHRVKKREKSSHVDESPESQVMATTASTYRLLNYICLPPFYQIQR